ncbi:MAG TPA: LysR family transcriptional regulator [Enterobacter asburiae]|jgi:DNA-binding transcriptional LysR family regulator|uniref:DNA-binding transcriptional repressor CitR n=1 Tax=Enterobacter asburiae TaxID=61645 RepID=UPI000E7D5326|nr:LysR family transcriptional regulator [Enterobacter asburiae]MBG0651140.1 LysR family transcriptional regulator [Enterobacter asburiae]MCK6655370.1 LysR family transcriptional regulator [Enterobacter asburiae]WJW91440.1 LysR family transcriptional regulator [Enterobacter asburiae]HBW94126.1 LysR family transcriptional regulator [Enterobacter asburiae]HCF68088.1 LysR family transcriptional regulator [Enterobacter asburiae]
MANLYDLKKFDLNLLVIFECIYQHLSISKAAETLYITPSAVSQSLQRLRGQLNDPLFIRSGKGITPTTVGVNLHHHLEQNLNQLEQTINIMHSSGLKKNFVIYCPHFMSTKATLDPIKLLMENHNYSIELHDVFLSSDSAEDLLAYRRADLIFSFSSSTNHSVACSVYHKLPFVLVCREGHPRLSENPTREEILNENFTAYLNDENSFKDYQEKAENLLTERNIVYRSDSFISLLSVIGSSDLIGLVPAPAFEQYGPALNLRKVETDIQFPSIDIYMMYNRSALNSSAFASFIEEISLP